MRGFTSLRELRVGAPGMTQEWRPILEELVRILEALYNPNALRVAAVVVKNSNARSTRREFLSSLSILEEARVLKALTGLRAIRFEVTETARGENDEVWWQQKLEEHMPRMRRVVSIVAEVTGIGQYVHGQSDASSHHFRRYRDDVGRGVWEARVNGGYGATWKNCRECPAVELTAWRLRCYSWRCHVATIEQGRDFTGRL